MRAAEEFGRYHPSVTRPSVLDLARALSLAVFVASASVSVAAQSPAASQPLDFWLRDGSMLRGFLIGWDTDADGPRVLAGGGGDRERVLGPELLSVHGPVPVANGSVQVDLAGGGRVVGDLLGGDDAGETFIVQSSALGRVPVQVDRLLCLRFVARSGAAGAESFAVPSSDADEALFRPLRAREGFSSLVGAIHRFEERRVLFQRVGDAKPRGYLYEQLAAISLRGGFEAEDPGPWMLLTRAGDLLRVHILGGAEEGRLTARVGDNDSMQFLVDDIACLTAVREDRRPLADLVPVDVEERGFFETERPLLRYRTRKPVGEGSTLVAGGRAWIEGVGVHSRARLRYAVPAGFSAFVARAAIDDSVLSLPVRADVRITVKVDDEIAVDEQPLRSGDAPLAVGPLEVAEGQTLELLVGFGKGLDLGDRVDWLGAVFLR